MSGSADRQTGTSTLVTASTRSVVVGDMEVTAFDSIDECAEFALALAAQGAGGTVAAINAEKLVACRKSESVKKALRRAALRYPDGVGVVLAMRMKGVKTTRIPGADLWQHILSRAEQGTRIALIGARPDVVLQTAAKVNVIFPNVDTVLVRDGFDGARDLGALKSAIMETRPQVVFVAMGSPKQEIVIGGLATAYPAALYMGLGGSFDVFVGLKKRAPTWMQRAGLEWLYRLMTEPSRLRRQTRLPEFVWLLMTGRM